MKRRQFLAAAAATAAAGTAVSCSLPKSAWKNFTPEEAGTLEAICDQFIPADEDPGAVWAGAVKYIDRQLSRQFKPLQEDYRRGLAAINAMSREMFGKAYIDLAAERQVEILQILEKNKAPAGIWKEIPGRRFFDMVLGHTMQGFYGNPRHGGNREACSWKMLGVPRSPIRGRDLDPAAEETGRRSG